MEEEDFVNLNDFEFDNLNPQNRKAPASKPNPVEKKKPAEKMDIEKTKK
jgi:hypothetical protein